MPRPAIPSTRSPSREELFYAAGLLEGEGCFSRGSSASTVSCEMTDTEPLQFLATRFGGRVHARKPRPAEPAHYKQRFTWRVNGARARGLALTLYSLLSPRRKAAVRKMLAAFPPASPHATDYQCRHGHPWTPETTIHQGHDRVCRICKRARDRARAR